KRRRGLSWLWFPRQLVAVSPTTILAVRGQPAQLFGELALLKIRETDGFRFGVDCVERMTEDKHRQGRGVSRVIETMWGVDGPVGSDQRREIFRPLADGR